MTKSAIFVFLSSYFKKELVSWYASMQKFKLELDQFGAFSTTWSHEVSLFTVESSFFIQKIAILEPFVLAVARG